MYNYEIRKGPNIMEKQKEELLILEEKLHSCIKAGPEK